jgi:hypothetical protein
MGISLLLTESMSVVNERGLDGMAVEPARTQL